MRRSGPWRRILGRLRLIGERWRLRRSTSALEWAGVAERHLAAGAWARAREIVAAGRRRFPGSRRLRELELRLEEHRTRREVQHLRARLARNPDPHLYARLGDLCRRAGDLREAEELAEACKARFPGDARGYLLAGEVRLERFCAAPTARDGRLALANLEQAVALEPQNLRARSLLARLYAALGDSRRARIHLEWLQEAQAAPREAEAWLAGLEPGTGEADLECRLLELERRGRCPALLGPPHPPARASPEVVRLGTETLRHRPGLRAVWVWLPSTAAPVGWEERGLRGFAAWAGEVLKAAQTSARRMDMGGFVRGFLEGPYGRILLRRHEGLELAAHVDARGVAGGIEAELEELLEKAWRPVEA